MCKTIGILGGMGPFATLDLFEKIIANTPATKDQEHIPIVIYNNPKVPSRVTAYFNKEERELLKELQKGALILEKAGADFILMPCHTAHIWLDQLKENLNIPLYSIIDTTTNAIKRGDMKAEKLLLLATSATVQSEIYQKAFLKSKVVLLVPTKEEQKTISSAIDYLKAGSIYQNPYLDPLKKILREHIKRGTSGILGGCTEIPLLFPLLENSLIKIDPTLLLAKRAIKEALKP